MSALAKGGLSKVSSAVFYEDTYIGFSIVTKCTPLFPINILHRQKQVRQQMKSDHACTSVTRAGEVRHTPHYSGLPKVVGPEKVAGWTEIPGAKHLLSPAVEAYRPGAAAGVLPGRGKWRGYRPALVKVASSPTRPRQGGGAGASETVSQDTICLVQGGLTCALCTQPGFLSTHASPRWYEVKAQAPLWARLPAQYPRCVARLAHAPSIVPAESEWP